MTERITELEQQLAHSSQNQQLLQQQVTDLENKLHENELVEGSASSDNISFIATGCLPQYQISSGEVVDRGEVDNNDLVELVDVGVAPIKELTSAVYKGNEINIQQYETLRKKFVETETKLLCTEQDKEKLTDINRVLREKLRRLKLINEALNDRVIYMETRNMNETSRKKKVTMLGHMVSESNIVEKSTNKKRQRPNTTSGNRKKRKLSVGTRLPVVCFSGFDSTVPDSYKDIVIALGGKIYDSNEFSHRKISHMVIPDNSAPTERCMAAILSGKWIMSPSWLIGSKEAGRFLPFSDFGKSGTFKPLKDKLIYIAPLLIESDAIKRTTKNVLVLCGGGTIIGDIDIADIVIVSSDKSELYDRYPGKVYTWTNFQDRVMKFDLP
eukprot:TRINITY_DN376_c4_g1_i1.p1 TRINITY_DN376_c4_g1~~TRINITY_DN376_c4_g1_i1.p1  ORF type:complete len:413 (+),score=91.45 TRINITY_DN376_c4_g1_i1:90-1241(+)